MAFPLEQNIIRLQLNDYGMFVVITTVWYDYVLTLPSEVEYIWNKRWTWVSTLFILARYSGLFGAVFNVLFGSSFLPRPRKMYVSSLHLCANHYSREVDHHFGSQKIVLVLCTWNFWVFMCAIDMVMILRLWALYNRSRLILFTLLAFYVVEIISFFISYVVVSSQFSNYSTATATQGLQFSFCLWQQLSPIWTEILYGGQIALGTLMVFLVTIQFVKESLQVYKMTKRFQLNPYMKLLARDGIMYFLVILVYALVNVLRNAGIDIGSGWHTILAAVLQDVPQVTLAPRFILSLRDLYARDLQGRQGDNIDSAFGLGSGHDTTTSTVVFKVAEQYEDESDEIWNIEKFSARSV